MFQLTLSDTRQGPQPPTIPFEAYLLMHTSIPQPIHNENYGIMYFCLHTTMGAMKSPYIMKIIHHYHIHYEKVYCNTIVLPSDQFN